MSTNRDHLIFNFWGFLSKTFDNRPANRLYWIDFLSFSYSNVSVDFSNVDKRNFNQVSNLSIRFWIQLWFSWKYVRSISLLLDFSCLLFIFFTIIFSSPPDHFREHRGIFLGRKLFFSFLGWITYEIFTFNHELFLISTFSRHFSV